MAITRAYNVPLREITTFRMGGLAKEAVTVESESELAELFASLEQGREWLVLGGGSNVVFPDGDFAPLLIRFAPKGISVSETDAGIFVTAAAGVVWDDLVAFCVEHGLSGLEALSAIPGSVGATPVQNVGAYGTEIKDTLVSVRAFDTLTKSISKFTNAECGFSYRDSMFKREGKGRYIITEATFRLSKQKPAMPSYAGVSEYFAERGLADPTLAQIREAIIFIRSNKLPDPREIASVGSFFKNPIVPKEQAEALKAQYPKLAVFPTDESRSKVGAGSLIDQLGWKGRSFGSISIYKNNALVLVNEGGATRAELAAAVRQIQAAVLEKYGVAIEPEPELL